MRKITDFNEFLALWLPTHSYYNTPKAQQDAFKQYQLYITNDGLILIFDRPTITSELLYDDETEAPSTELQNFINYNLRYNFKYDNTEYQEQIKNLQNNGACSGSIELYPYFVITRSNSKQFVAPILYNYNDRKINDINRGSFVRDLTPNEVQEYFTICDELQQEYITRLHNYYKRYAKNISTRGYWANR